MTDNTTFAEQLNLAQHRAMEAQPDMLCFGLGMDDPKAIFNTTKDLHTEFGEDRVFDMPTAENGMTGIAIGAAMAGSPVLMTHQRVDFFLLAMDQLVNNAAKWHYMFNGQMRIPLTIRLIVGRGWGQGPTHQQSLQSWFAHIPGLKVITPSLTQDVGALLYQSLLDPNPCVVIEHRWLHNQSCPEALCTEFTQTQAKTHIRREGKDVTLISNSYMTLEAIHAANHLVEMGIDAEILDLTQLTETDWPRLYDSVNKTGHCVIADIGHKSFGIGAEISARLMENCFSALKAAPVRLGLPDYPEPTSFGLTEDYYNDANSIVQAVAALFGKTAKAVKQKSTPHDVPGDWFTGPF